MAGDLTDINTRIGVSEYLKVDKFLVQSRYSLLLLDQYRTLASSLSTSWPRLNWPVPKVTIKKSWTTFIYHTSTLGYAFVAFLRSWRHMKPFHTWSHPWTPVSSLIREWSLVAQTALNRQYLTVRNCQVDAVWSLSQIFHRANPAHDRIPWQWDFKLKNTITISLNSQVAGCRHFNAVSIQPKMLIDPIDARAWITPHNYADFWIDVLFGSLDVLYSSTLSRASMRIFNHLPFQANFFQYTNQPPLTFHLNPTNSQCLAYTICLAALCSSSLA